MRATGYHDGVFSALNPVPAHTRPDLLAPGTYEALKYVPEALVFEIDPVYGDTEALCEHFGLPLEVMGNAVLVLGKRAGEERYACCMTLAHRRVDVNNVVRRKLDVRKASFAPMDYAVTVSGMEYGGITPVGLPADWPIWVDSKVAEVGQLCIGSGVRKSKLLLPGRALLDLPNSELVEELARDIPA
jgi:prolyl-tRNA editing enzyme YbaK/EbsC (Cys-tRNA(Pro) deacylase)